MTINDPREAINKLARELCLAQGTFDYFEVNRLTSKWPLWGLEHFTKDMEEVVALYRDGTEAGRFKSVGDASLKLGIHQSCVSDVIRGVQQTAGGLKFMKARDYELVPRKDPPPPRLF